jgi:hypothetical protein
MNHQYAYHKIIFKYAITFYNNYRTLDLFSYYFAREIHCTKISLGMEKSKEKTI